MIFLRAEKLLGGLKITRRWSGWKAQSKLMLIIHDFCTFHPTAAGKLFAPTVALHPDVKQN